MKHFVVCENKCLIEGMTKEEIFAAIADATGNTPTPTGEAFITQIVNQNNGESLKIWRGTQAQYNAIAEKDANTYYIITDAKVLAPAHADSHKKGGSDELKPEDIGAAKAASIVAYTLLANKWSGNEYNLETEYSAGRYDLEIALNGDSVTEEQKEAFDSAQLVGFASANKLKAFGAVPTVNIPIILKVVEK